MNGLELRASDWAAFTRTLVRIVDLKPKTKTDTLSDQKLSCHRETARQLRTFLRLAIAVRAILLNTAAVVQL